ncbi:MAG: hypothetical protein M1816_000339 [Peltula sp. TS41687]|nr:MAG: hypothetical protein M1816_000339 [Peltula sp. TS41687]
MRPHLFLPFFLQLLPLTAQAQPISHPLGSDEPSTPAAQDEKKTDFWPIWISGVPLAAWALHQASRHLSHRPPTVWGYPETVEEVFDDLDLNNERYQAETRLCVQRKFLEVFPRQAFTLESVFNGQMSVAQHTKALPIVEECVERTNEIIAVARSGPKGDAQTQQDESNPVTGVPPENERKGSENSNPLTLEGIGKILNAGKQGTSPHGVLPASFPGGISGFVYY